MTIRIGSKSIGDGAPCFVVAEIGINHNGDLDLARRSIDAARAAGADAVKLQNFRTEDFVSDRTLTYEYTSGGQLVREAQWDMFKRCELDRAALCALADHARAAGIVLFSTPTSEEGIADMQAAGMPLVKNGSDYLTNTPLIEAMARSGLPTVLSTGMATLGEIDDAVRAFSGAGGTELVLLVCTSRYPTPPSDVHLRRLPSLRAAFDLPVGFSDHTDGPVAALGSVVLGACFVEKHFTLDRELPGPDHRFSIEPAEQAELVSGIRTLEASLGQGRVGYTEGEAAARAGYRLSCVAAHGLEAGRELSAADIAFRRPGQGLAPKLMPWLAGRRLLRAVPRGHVFLPEDFGT
jgi:N,N'-diacetyllegionaminate synthase